MPEKIEGVGPGRVSGSRYENFQTYLWDSVCSAGVSFCFLERGFRKVFLKDKEIFGKNFLRHARVRDTKRPREDRTLRRHDLKMN